MLYETGRFDLQLLKLIGQIDGLVFKYLTIKNNILHFPEYYTFQIIADGK